MPPPIRDGGIISNEFVAMSTSSCARPTGLGLVMLLGTGQAWAEMKQLWGHGAKAYVRDMWNIVEFVTISLYVTTYALKFVSYFLVRHCGLL